MRCRNPVTGKMQTNRLGAYPKMGIADARRACRAAHDRVKQEGVNLTDERRAKKAAASNSGDTHTLKTLLDVYAKHAAKSFPENRGAIDNVYAPLLDKRMSELTKTEINMAALEYGLKKETKHYPNLAYRLLKHALRWATVNLAGIKADLLNIQKPYRVPTRRERALSNAELNRLLLALSASKALHAKATKFLLLTATRLEETTHATWAEFDLANGVWTIPAARRKQPKPHVPAVELVLDLPKQAMEILTEMAKKPHTNTSWVFPNSN
ncbi:MAG TPA: tyrosine-type recombinase/integrase, partial [Acetobacteraceae bacterium]|nr:tyrosine-type recombinase/integrase [Acetobacteraceae bacterium]